jgi:carbon-monoxide dehydrogenase medium subunit
MPLPRFTYLKPKSLREASTLLAEHGDKARIMAGGTDLMIRLAHRAVTPQFVIGLGHLPDLDGVKFDPAAGLVIGALARLSQVAEHPEVRKHYPALAYAASQTATVQIRNMGTVVGNITNAAPSADNATPLLVYAAQVVILHPGGERTLPLAEFFRGPGLTALESGEIVKELRLPVSGPRSGSSYQKISQRSRVDIAAVGVSAYMDLDDGGRAVRVRAALGAVGPVPLMARRTMASLEGKELNHALIVQAGSLAAQESSPISDVRASADYRGRMVDVLTVRALTAAWAMARERRAGCEL